MENLLKGIKKRIQLMVGRCVLAVVDDSKGIQTVQVEVLGGVLEDVQRLQNYGMSSNPPEGSKGVMASICGNREDSVIIAMDNQEFRIKNLAPGESVLYDNLGQLIHLKKDGSIKILATKKINLDSTEEINLTTPLVKSTTDLTDFQTKKMKLVNPTCDFVKNSRELSESLESAKVLTVFGLQDIIPGGKTWTVLKTNYQSFEE